MQSDTETSQKKIGLLAITAVLAALIWLVGGAVLLILLQQQTRIEGDAQHIFDVSSAKVFEATRTIRGLERLAREGDAIHGITDPAERKQRRQRLHSLLDDASLQGDERLRLLVARAFGILDKNIEELGTQGTAARAAANDRWAPVMQELVNHSEAIGAEVADLATQEADHIMISTAAARRMLLYVAFSLALASVALFLLIYFGLTYPLVRLSRDLQLAREGKPIVHAEEAVRELQMLHDAAEALSAAHRKLEFAQVQLEQMAHTDMLTGLANRRMFEIQGQQAFEHAKRHGEPLCVLMFDIDFFKRVNDQYGHAGGDSVLRELGRYLRSAQRGSDSPAARLGGEEFGLLLTKATLHEAALTAERLRQGIAQLSVTMPGGEKVQFTISLGVAECTAEDSGLNALVRRADTALYAAKQNGRNRVELAA